ncbi:MAG: HAD hydrolase-like protein, partial [Bacteroidales bacterium]|nr:HAD hydrolase-like protein [Bacteroidales bacterium]
ERHKPYPDPMLAYLRTAGATAETTLYLGDTQHDWRCGHDAGCDFALADWRLRGDQGIPAEYRFTDAASLRAVLGL